MTAIYFNSWLEEYKQPFGAIEKGAAVTFSIAVQESIVEQVLLVVRKEGGERGFEKINMSPEEHHHYICTYTLEQGAGLYFYYFEIIKKESDQDVKTIYCGSDQGKGGEGVLTYDSGNLHPYQLTCYEKADPAPDWYRKGIVYQIFPDRFYNGNPHKEISQPKKNTFIYGTWKDEPMYIKDAEGEIIRWDFYGGNLQGIIEKIPYLKELGVTALYLNPIFESASNHRYDTGDYLAIDGMLGDEKTFLHLLDCLHENDMQLILDGVFSHVGRNSRYFNYDGRYGEGVGAYRNPKSRYRQWFKFSDYPEDYKSWWGVRDLPEADKENSNFQQFIYGEKESVLEKWTAMGVDGWRLDVADELPDFFIEGIRQAVNRYPEKVLLGEVWEDASNKISYGHRRQYIFGNSLHGVMNYPFRDIILSLLLGKHSAQEAAEKLTVLQENYPADIFANNLNNIGTHDSERIATLLDNHFSKLTLAVGLMFVLPGVPTIYYGDEAGVTGGKDPENRKFFPWDAIDPDAYTCYQEWTQKRKATEALVYGEFYPFYSNGLLGVLRYSEQSQFALYLVNAQNQTASAEELIFTRKPPISTAILEEMLADAVISEWGDYFVVKELS
ncbi:glycoside hydrolase family 13 protein [Enterococcus sp. CWB-B31]|uniref:glycoside hydrolase family 13 protein n=1 Tax=Enterococcus sp. CWB-B31 TaxID=2885159 RepID=UPI001E286A22|nr:glycoside hydrolase family 13 protein [Enterococcus sp. CWB-B31]MCB5953902.1 glycoside hydrolase family 13 protein [Enterococcus sp. CWB-B31]